MSPKAPKPSMPSVNESNIVFGVAYESTVRVRSRSCILCRHPNCRGFCCHRPKYASIPTPQAVRDA